METINYKDLKKEFNDKQRKIDRDQEKTNFLKAIKINQDKKRQQRTKR